MKIAAVIPPIEASKCRTKKALFYREKNVFLLIIITQSDKKKKKIRKNVILICLVCWHLQTHKNQEPAHTFIWQNSLHNKKTPWKSFSFPSLVFIIFFLPFHLYFQLWFDKWEEKSFLFLFSLSFLVNINKVLYKFLWWNYRNNKFSEQKCSRGNLILQITWNYLKWNEQRTRAFLIKNFKDFAEVSKKVVQFVKLW